MTNTSCANESVPSAAHLVIAAGLTDADVALIAKVDGLASRSGGLFAIPFKAMSEAEWARIAVLNDQGFLGT